MSKLKTRKKAKEIITSFTTEKRSEIEAEKIKLISENKEFLKAKKVGIYHPLNHEINLLKLMALFKDKSFYFPKTNYPNMDFRLVTDIDELVDGKFNLKEPGDNAIIEADIDVYLVPCLATNKNYRLGHGAGYYDRYFSIFKGYKIGVVHSELKDEEFSVNDHDIPMDEII